MCVRFRQISFTEYNVCIYLYSKCALVQRWVITCISRCICTSYCLLSGHHVRYFLGLGLSLGFSIPSPIGIHVLLINLIMIIIGKNVSTLTDWLLVHFLSTILVEQVLIIFIVCNYLLVLGSQMYQWVNVDIIFCQGCVYNADHSWNVLVCESVRYLVLDVEQSIIT